MPLRTSSTSSPAAGLVPLRRLLGLTYSDYEVMAPQATRLLGLTRQQVEQEIGNTVPVRAVAMQRAYPLAFFDLHPRQRGHLLDPPSPRFPEVTFIPWPGPAEPG